jgi:hypothetical protein
MNMQRNILLARKAIAERAHGAHSFVVDARLMLDRSQLSWFFGRGLALPVAGDLIA